MSRKVDKPKKRVLSVRITESEWAELQRALQKNAVDVSTVLRKGLDDFLKVAG